jgi:pimeloyl-ACP methyl ester carboxylesterase
MSNFIPTIFLPGIQGTALADTNTFDFDLVWNAYDTLGTSIGTSIMGPHIDEALNLNPRFDQQLTSVIERNHIARFPYQGTMNLYQSKFRDVNSPLFLFGYDWRKSNVDSGKKLYDFLHYLKDKFEALGHSIDGFNFIAHSMGSHVAGCCLGQLRNANELHMLHKMVLCAPPLMGSPYALEGMIAGKGGLRRFFRNLMGKDDEMRKVVRTYPSVFELLPWYDGALAFKDGPSIDLLKMEHWQSNLIKDETRALFERRLTDLTAYRNGDFPALSSFSEDVRKRIIVIYGTDDDKDTLQKLKVTPHLYGTANYVRLVKKDVKLDGGMGYGDGTVPAVSANAYANDVLTFEVEQAGILQEPDTHLDFHGMFLRDARVRNIMFRFLLAPGLYPEASGNEEWWKSRSDDVRISGNHNNRVQFID